MNGEEETKEVRSVWMTDEEIKILLDLLEDSKYHNKEMFDCEVELCSTLYSVDESDEDKYWLSDKNYSISEAVLYAMALLSFTLILVCLI